VIKYLNICLYEFRVIKNLNICSYEFGVIKCFWLKSILVDLLI